MTPELTERYARLRKFLDGHIAGGCKMLSQGDACTCILCDLDALAYAVREHEKPPQSAATDAFEDAIQASRRAAAAWQKTADAYQKAIDMITKIQEAHKCGKKKMACRPGGR